METDLDGKVALISGIARGQGRSHALRLAELGVAIIGFDICSTIPSVPYDMPDEEDLAETVARVEAISGQILADKVDVRDIDAIRRLTERGVERFGRLDIVIANAGIYPAGGRRSGSLNAWHDAIDVMLTGVFNTVWAARDHLLHESSGKSIVLISSTAGLKGQPADGSAGTLGYVAAKHGVVGLMRAWANEFGPHGIRVNSIHPCGVNTPMVMNERFQQHMARHPEVAAEMRNLLPVDVIQPEDVSNAVAFLVSSAGRYITGQTLGVDAGYVVR